MYHGTFNFTCIHRKIFKSFGHIFKFNILCLCYKNKNYKLTMYNSTGHTVSTFLPSFITESMFSFHSLVSFVKFSFACRKEIRVHGVLARTTETQNLLMTPQRSTYVCLFCISEKLSKLRQFNLKLSPTK